MFANVLNGIGSCGDDHMSGGWWWVMGIGWLVFLAAVATIVYALTRHHAPPATGASPQDILAERFARGDIDAEEYRARSDVLRG